MVDYCLSCKVHTCHVGSSRSPFDYCKSSPPNMDLRWTPPGVHMEYTRSPQGVQVESRWNIWNIEGVRRESTRTLWSPHGVHSYPWGSVTYRDDPGKSDFDQDQMVYFLSFKMTSLFTEFQDRIY
jgi:hypothetical protein